MSVSLILVPAALAVAGLAGGAGVFGAMSQRDEASESAAAPRPSTVPVAPVPSSVTVQTRMKDADLLSAALRDLGAAQVDRTGDELTAVVDDLELRMTRDAEGIWAAFITGADGREANRAEAESLVQRMDSAYAHQVQQAVAERIRSRADSAGFELVSESRQDDDSVTMVLSVRDAR